jgi:flavin reductase (DIM6/NTAB) family NADH-FMN oxidoreductase RutF
MESISDQLRKTMRLWASGVVVVTTSYNEVPGGMTVSSFTSVTIEPPVILVCLNKSAYTLKLIRKSRIFAVSVLGEEHREISRRFAGEFKQSEGDRFYDVPTETALTGSPILKDSIAWLDCKVTRIRDMVTHFIVGGQVLATGQRKNAGKPLLYYDRDYRKIGS